MSPPDLTGNAPVADIFQPVQIDLVKPLRHKLQVAVLDRLDGRLCQLVHLHKPLLLDERLHCGVTAVMGSHVVGMGLYLHKVSLLLQILHHGLSGLVAVHACVFSTILLIDGGVVVHDIDLRQIVALSDLKVVGVVGRRDLHRSGSELLIHIVVRHNGDLPVSQGEQTFFAHKVFVALVIRMYRDGCVSQHGLRTCGRDLQVIVSSHDGILDVPEMSLLLLMLYLRVGEGCLAHRAPVDDPGAFIDIAFLIQADENLLHCLGTALVHGEPLSVPVAGDAQLLQLRLDGSRIFFLPLPGALQELLPSQLLLVNAFLFQLVGHLHLRGDSSVICSRDPEGVVALHPLIADQDILQGVVKSVAHVQLSGNVRWRHHRCKGLSAPVHFRVEIFFLAPLVV